MKKSITIVMQFAEPSFQHDSPVMICPRHDSRVMICRRVMIRVSKTDALILTDFYSLLKRRALRRSLIVLTILMNVLNVVNGRKMEEKG